VKRSNLIFIMVASLLFATSVWAASESCVSCVRALVSWATTKNIPTTNNAADSMASNAKNNGFTVNNSASGCSSSKPCILVYPRTYGNGIDSSYGHVAVLKSDKNSKGTVTITDSNGICGGYRKTCSTTPNWNKVKVIHPKN
jgi:hypothetical protein